MLPEQGSLAQCVDPRGLESAPPVEALRTVLTYVEFDIEGEKPKCREGTSPNRMQLSLIDISRAYFNATYDPAKPPFVALPTEHPDYQSTCGLLLKNMYGFNLPPTGGSRGAARVSSASTSSRALPALLFSGTRGAP